MSEVVSKYFAPPTPGNKRNHSSTSSESCSSPTEFRTSDREKQEKKKQKTIAESSESSEKGMNMEDLKISLDSINQKLTSVCMKEDIEKIRDEMTKISESVNRRVDILESTLFDIQAQKDKLNEDVDKLKKENTSLRSQLETERKETRDLKVVQNDNEQHARGWNLRVYGVQEARWGEETVSDCVTKCLEVFNAKVGVQVRPEDIGMAHRTGRPQRGGQDSATGRPRPIILRFFSRQKRSQVLQGRRKLKQSGLSIGDDLTLANYRLLKQASAHSATMSVNERKSYSENENWGKHSVVDLQQH